MAPRTTGEESIGPDDGERDARLIREIGRSLAEQDLRVEVRLPRHLADGAVDAWRRLESRGLDPAAEARSDAGPKHNAVLGLIGLSLEQGGRADGDVVVVELEAWYIGDTLNAADQAGSLYPGRGADIDGQA